MKDSSKWLRSTELNKKLDQLVEERGCTPADINIYDAAKALGVEPNGDFYRRVRDWKQRRAAEADRHLVEVPASAQAEFREVLDGFTEGAMAAYVRVVRAVGGVLNAAAALRITDAERRRDEALAEVNDLLDRWDATDAALKAAQARCEQLEQDLADAHRREQRLLGRLEQREADGGGADDGQGALGEQAEVAAPPVPNGMSALLEARVRGPEVEFATPVEAAFVETTSARSTTPGEGATDDAPPS